MVAAIDAWTSPSGDGRERRDVFAPGEMIQFNGLFATERDTPTRVRVLFILQSLSNAVATRPGATFGDGAFEIAFMPQRGLDGEFTVSPAVQHPYIRFRIPEFDGSFTWRGQRDTAVELASGGFGYIFANTLYSFRMMVRFLDVATGQTFDMTESWHYGITA